MKSLIILTYSIYFLLAPFSSQKKVIVHVTPADATISEVVQGTGELKQLGIGIATVLIPKNSTVTIVMQKSGYADITRVYSAVSDEKLPKEEFYALKDRQVDLKVSPSDAKTFSNGVELANSTSKITVKEGQRVNIEVKKAGFVSVTRTYTNQAGAEPPPLSDDIKLRDRVIQVVTSPSDAKILADNQLISTEQGKVVVPFDRCVVVKVLKDGFAEIEKTYCNKEGGADLPANESFLLQDRVVIVRATPEDANIKINGRYVAKGEYNVKVAKGDCVELTVERDGSIPVRKNYCNQDNAPLLPVTDHLDLVTDEAFSASSTSTTVNINNIIEVNARIKSDEGWKIMSQVVMNYFDVIEITDKETGYLRTAWSVKTFPNNTIRTRIIVKTADSATLKYVVKLCSEASGKNGSNSGDDSLYSEWPRALEAYKNLVEDIQSRMK